MPVRFLLFVPRILPRLALALLGLAAATPGRADDEVRFSAMLTAGQRDGTGLSTLTADNLAVIDGLVRRDEAASKYRNNNVDHTRFSQRRTARERDIAGLDRLTPEQIALLDELVGRRITGPAAAASAAYPAAARVANPATQRPLEIHGEISFTYGWGKGGSVRGGDLALYYADPEHHYAVFCGYSEYYGKGRLPCFYPGSGHGVPYIENLPFED